MESCASLTVAKLAKTTWVKITEFLTVKANVDFAPFATLLPFPLSKAADTVKMELMLALPLARREKNCVLPVVKLVVLLRIWFRK